MAEDWDEMFERVVENLQAEVHRETDRANKAERELAELVADCHDNEFVRDAHFSPTPEKKWKCMAKKGHRIRNKPQMTGTEIGRLSPKEEIIGYEVRDGWLHVVRFLPTDCIIYTKTQSTNYADRLFGPVVVRCTKVSRDGASSGTRGTNSWCLRNSWRV
eukprot:SAG22_NODE_1448_length_4401_cov_14.320242_3_plen_160_part_00